MNKIMVTFIVSAMVLFTGALAYAQTNLKYSQNLYLGMRSSSVATLQRDLSSNQYWYPQKLVTGYFGNLTFKAVQRFQGQYHIQQTGYVGPLTRAELNKQFYSNTADQCSIGATWGCRSVSQGTFPNHSNPPPAVCGCVPNTCPAGTYLISDYAGGTWPDGSLKGLFTCSAQLPS